jgi:hypothetical protein
VQRELQVAEAKLSGSDLLVSVWIVANLASEKTQPARQQQQLQWPWPQPQPQPKQP